MTKRIQKRLAGLLIGFLTVMTLTIGITPMLSIKVEAETTRPITTLTSGWTDIVKDGVVVESSGDGWSFDMDTATMTLTSAFSPRRDNGIYPIKCDGDINIKITETLTLGSNSMVFWSNGGNIDLEIPEGVTFTANSSGGTPIYAEYDINIHGKGTLNANGGGSSSSGMESRRGSVTIDIKNCNAKGTTNNADICTGQYSSGDIVIGKTQSVNLNCNGTGTHYGVYCKGGNIYINNSNVYLAGRTYNDTKVSGFYANGKTVTIDNSTVSMGTFNGSIRENYGFYCSNLNIKGNTHIKGSVSSTLDDYRKGFASGNVNVTGDYYYRSSNSTEFVKNHLSAKTSIYEFELVTGAHVSCTNNGDTHTIKCKDANCFVYTVVKENEAHTYTPATCSTPQTCTECGATTGTTAPHSCKYTVNGNVITETCENECGHSATATLELDTSASLGYTGSAIHPLKVTYSDNWSGSKSLEITYNDACIARGEHSGSITCGDVTATKSFTITLGTIKGVVYENVNTAYDGNSHKITVYTDNLPEGITLTFSTSQDGTYSSENPEFTDVGTYTVWFRIVHEDYNTISGTASVKISQATNTWETAPSISDWTYGETASTPTAAAKFGTAITIQYKLADADDLTYTSDVPTNAGKYKARFSVEGTDNYTALSTEVEFSIKKVQLIIKGGALYKTYGTDDPELTWDIVYGSVVEGETLTGITVSRVAGEDVNVYAVKVTQTVGANPNYDITFQDGTFRIICASNEWVVAPAISNGVYGTALTITTPQAKFGTITVNYSGYTMDRTPYNSTTLPTDAGNYTAVFKVEGTANYNGIAETSIQFTIEKANRSAPEVEGISETIDGKGDGKIIGLTDEMEYCNAIALNWTQVSGTELTDLADGTYYVRYKATNNYNVSNITEIVLNGTTKLTVTVPTSQIGYTLTVDKTSLSWHESVTITFKLSSGYSKINGFAVMTGNTSSITYITEFDAVTGSYTLRDVEANLDFTVQGVADITAPTGSIKIDQRIYNSLSSMIDTLFFNKAQTIEITSDDLGSGVKDVYYYIYNVNGTPLSESDLNSLEESSWTRYSEAFKLNTECTKMIIYAKIVDNAGNTKYICSYANFIDSVAPTISGIANGSTYYGDTTFTVTDNDEIESFEVDESIQELTNDKYTIIADGNSHTIVVTDRAGNKTELTITVIAISSIDDDIEDITVDNVKSSDETAIREVLELVNELINSDKTFTDTENEQLAAMKTNAEALLSKLSEIDSALETDDIVNADGINSNNVTPNDKEKLEKADTELRKVLEDYKNNLSEGEKSDINNEIIRIKEALDVINDVKEVEDLIDALPEEITIDDADAINEADEAYGELSEHGKSIVDQDKKQKLDDAKAELERLILPDTGDNSSIWLWLAILLASVAGLFSANVLRRNRKEA